MSVNTLQRQQDTMARHLAQNTCQSGVETRATAAKGNNRAGDYKGNVQENEIIMEVFIKAAKLVLEDTTTVVPKEELMVAFKAKMAIPRKIVIAILLGLQLARRHVHNGSGARHQHVTNAAEAKPVANNLLLRDHVSDASA